MVRPELFVALVAIALPEAADPASALWEKLIQYGAIGAILVYLLWERKTDRKEDRKSRNYQANAIQENTLVTARLSQNVKGLTDAIWLSMGHAPRRGEDTPPKQVRPEGDTEQDLRGGT